MAVAELQLVGGNRTARVDPTREYQSGGVLAPSTEQSLRALSGATSDDIMRELSWRVYAQMMTDPELAKCVQVIKVCVMGDGVELVQAIERGDPAEVARAREIKEFCDRSLHYHLQTRLTDTLEQMLDALVYGHKIAELTYRIPETGRDRMKLVLDKIKVKPRDSVRFVVDRYLNVVGFVGANPPAAAQTTAPLGVDAQGRATLGGLPILPREKFMVLSLRKQDEDPRGSSFLRPAFNAWHLKNQVWPEYLRFLMMCAVPILIGYTAVDKEGMPIKEYLRDEFGNKKLDNLSQPIEVNMVDALLATLVAARNATAIAVRGGSKVDKIEVNGSGEPFFKAIEMLDRQMESGILLQTLATSEGVHQARAASQTHQDVLDILIWSIKGQLCAMLEQDVIRQHVLLNFGEDDLPLMPRVSMGDTERHEFAADAAAVAALVNVGFTVPSQYRAIDTMLGLEPRDEPTPDEQLLSMLPDDWRKLIEEAQQPPLLDAKGVQGQRDKAAAAAQKAAQQAAAGKTQPGRGTAPSGTPSVGAGAASRRQTPPGSRASAQRRAARSRAER